MLTFITSDTLMKSNAHAVILPRLFKFLTLLAIASSSSSSLYNYLMAYLTSHSLHPTIALSIVMMILHDNSLQQQSFVFFQKQLEQHFSKQYIQMLACIIAEGTISVNRVLEVCNSIEKEMKRMKEEGNEVGIMQYGYFISAVMEYVKKSGENKLLLPFLQSMVRSGLYDSTYYYYLIVIQLIHSFCQ